MDRVKILKDLLAAQPGDSFIQHALALEYIKKGDELEAKRLFENVLANDDKYIGSYYHLAKLLERCGEKDAAIKWYKTGMLKAKEAGDQHAYNELQAAYEDLIDL
ncbi:MAG TPA: tetratricopeptide repeat protein [Flavisolibacter sp.]|nr:tetratricopeptide repeat protein [Flavisolibacter sp.]